MNEKTGWETSVLSGIKVPEHHTLVRCVIEGDASMLHDRYPAEQMIADLRQKTGSRSKPKDLTFEDEANPKVYRGLDGKTGIPTSNIFAAMREGGKEVALKGRAKMTRADGKSKLPAMVKLFPREFVPFVEDEEGNQPHWTPDIRQGKNEHTGGATCIVRPKFNAGWRLCFFVLINKGAEFADQKLVHEIVRAAGMYAGLGSFRPNCGGSFGTFTILEWEVVEEK